MTRWLIHRPSPGVIGALTIVFTLMILTGCSTHLLYEGSDGGDIRLKGWKVYCDLVSPTISGNDSGTVWFDVALVGRQVDDSALRVTLDSIQVLSLSDMDTSYVPQPDTPWKSIKQDVGGFSVHGLVHLERPMPQYAIIRAFYRVRPAGVENWEGLVLEYPLKFRSVTGPSGV